MDQDLILIVDGEAPFRAMLLKYLEDRRCPALEAANGQAALQMLSAYQCAVVVTALNLEDMDGLAVTRAAKLKDLDCEVIVTTPLGDVQRSLPAWREGAFDLMLKPLPELALFGGIVARALERRAINRQNKELIENLRRNERELEQRVQEAVAQISRDKTVFEIALRLAREVNQTLEREGVLAAIRNYFETLPYKWEYALCEYCAAEHSFKVVLHNHMDWPQDPPKTLAETDEPMLASVLWNNTLLTLGPSGGRGIAPQRGSVVKPVSILLPVQVAGTSLGVLIIHIRDAERISEEHTDLGLLSAEFVGMALNNSILFERTRELSQHDGLTGLYNHAYFQKYLEQEVRRAERYNHPLSIIMCDLNNFKLCNDQHGHQMGDQLLQRVAGRIAEQVRDRLDVVARYGGDEFVVVLPETDRTGAEVIAERLVAAMAEEAQNWPLQDAQHRQVGLSVGVGSFTRGMTREQLIATADATMYDFKAKSRKVSA